MQASFPEAMVSIDPCDKVFSLPPAHMERYSAIAVGPGIGTDQITQEALFRLLTERPAETPLVLDADAINILALHKEWLPLAEGAIITPHASEYERLFGNMQPSEAAVKYKLTVVSKAHHTEVNSPDQCLYVNDTGNAGMATAGSGDVLTGMLLGMLSANKLHSKIYHIVCNAVMLHGKIGDITIQKQSESSLIASDLVENLKYISTDITDG